MTNESSFQNANRLLRRSSWREALEEYFSVWEKSPKLRAMIAVNIDCCLRNSRPEEVDSKLRNKAQLLVNGYAADSAIQRKLTASQSQIIVNPEKVLTKDSVGKQRFDLNGERQLHSVLKNGLGIDQIYIVNLHRRPDRYIRALREMTRNGVAISRIDGVDAKFSQEAVDLYESFRSRPVTDRRPSSLHVSDAVMRRYKSQITMGAFGYILSQRDVIKDAIAKGYKRILVLDDDVFFCSNAADRINAFLPSLPKDLKILLLGASEYSDRRTDEFKRARISDGAELYRPLPGKTCGSFAMVYDYSVYAELLASIEEADGTFDNVVVGSIYQRHPNLCLTVDPAVCIPDVGDSDIREDVRAQKTHSERMHWEFKRYSEYTQKFRISILISDFASLRHVSSIKSELPSGVILSAFYLSDDGLRPVVLGHQFSPGDSKANILHSADVKLRSLVESLQVPYSDIVISWPSHKVLTEEAAVNFAASAWAQCNERGLYDGSLGDVPYCINVGARALKGKHSIIIPVFRGVEHAWPSIESALLQEAKNFEVVVVNDNPSNRNFSIDLKKKVQEWASKRQDGTLADRLIVLDHSKNRNASGARNTGLMKSTGEYISFLDDDDFFEPDRLVSVESSLQTEDPDFGGAYCGYSGSWNGQRNMDRFPEGDLGEMVLSLRYAEHYMCTNTVSFLRSTLQTLGGFNECYVRHQDLELMTRFFASFKISAVKKFCVKNRPSPVPETFSADISKLCRLKAQFLTDMRMEVLKRGSDFPELVLDAHSKDIAKRDKNMPSKTLDAINAFLRVAVHAHVTK